MAINPKAIPLFSDLDPRYAQVADVETIIGLWTFDRAPNSPFAVSAGSAKVDNLDADLLDGQHLSDLDARYANVIGDTFTGDVTFETQIFTDTINERTADAGVTIDGVLCKDGVIPDSAYPNALLLDGSRSMQGNLKPAETDTYSLGKASYAWYSIFVKNIMAPYKTTALNCGVHLLPDPDLSRNLGSAGAWWAHLFVRDVHLRDTGPIGDYHVRLKAYHDFLFVRNYNDTDYAGLYAKNIKCDSGLEVDGVLDVDGGLDFDDIDIAATSVSGLSAVIPVTVGGTTKYVPCYDSYA